MPSGQSRVNRVTQLCTDDAHCRESASTESVVLKVVPVTGAAALLAGHHGPINVCVWCVCVCFLPIHSGHQVRWTYQPGSHRRKVTQYFSSPSFCGACLNFYRERRIQPIPFPRRPWNRILCTNNDQLMCASLFPHALLLIWSGHVESIV